MKGAAGAVRSVGAGGETHDEDAGEWVAESGYGACPIGLVEVSTAPGLADADAVGAEAGAEFAGGDSFLDLDERFGEDRHLDDDRWSAGRADGGEKTRPGEALNQAAVRGAPTHRDEAAMNGENRVWR